MKGSHITQLAFTYSKLTIDASKCRLGSDAIITQPLDTKSLPTRKPV